MISQISASATASLASCRFSPFFLAPFLRRRSTLLVQSTSNNSGTNIQVRVSGRGWLASTILRSMAQPSQQLEKGEASQVNYFPDVLVNSSTNSSSPFARGCCPRRLGVRRYMLLFRLLSPSSSIVAPGQTTAVERCRSNYAGHSTPIWEISRLQCSLSPQRVCLHSLCSQLMYPNLCKSKGENAPP